MTSRTERPQFYPNILEPKTIDKETLLETLADLRAAIKQGVDTIENHYPPVSPAEAKSFGAISDGHLGIALLYLRLEYQSAYLGADGDHVPDFRKLVCARISPYPLDLDVQPGRPSPVASAALGAAVLRIINGRSPSSQSVLTDDDSESPLKDDIDALHKVFRNALDQSHVVTFRGHSIGGDEAMMGRSGLLWAISNINRHVVADMTQQELNPIFGAVPELVDAIIDAGQVGREEYIAVNGDSKALPLMFLWLKGCYGLGGEPIQDCYSAVCMARVSLLRDEPPLFKHKLTKSAGILAILLSVITASPADSPNRTQLPTIARAIIALAELCISHNGHLPMSIPDFPTTTTRLSPLVQICHGAPGLLHLLALARSNGEFTKTYWTSQCDKAIMLASERIWEEGLLIKGGGLCHGIAGNAWPWLMLHNAFEYTTSPSGETRGISGDDFLPKALAFLLHAKKTQPFNTNSDEYRLPDKPYGLYEGLSGTICAWAEACVVIVARLRKMDLDEQARGGSFEEDEIFQTHLLHQLGFPTLGGSRLAGLL